MRRFMPGILADGEVMPAAFDVWTCQGDDQVVSINRLFTPVCAAPYNPTGSEGTSFRSKKAFRSAQI